jgi:hypothetical protein
MWSKHKWYYPTVQISDGEDWLGMTHVLVKCEDFLPYRLSFFWDYICM